MDIDPGKGLEHGDGRSFVAYCASPDGRLQIRLLRSCDPNFFEGTTLGTACREVSDVWPPLSLQRSRVSIEYLTPSLRAPCIPIPCIP